MAATEASGLQLDHEAYHPCSVEDVCILTNEGHQGCSLVLILWVSSSGYLDYAGPPAASSLVSLLELMNIHPGCPGAPASLS